MQKVPIEINVLQNISLKTIYLLKILIIHYIGSINF